MPLAANRNCHFFRNRELRKPFWIESRALFDAASMSESTELFRRYLNQRRESGDTDLLLESLSARQAVRLASPSLVTVVDPEIRDAPGPILAQGWDELRELALTCTRCELSPVS